MSVRSSAPYVAQRRSFLWPQFIHTRRARASAHDSALDEHAKCRFAGLNLEPVGSTPQEFAAFLKEDLQRYARIAKAAGIEPQ
jgi:tripartite-type tricarboxylate transporter receptor subunit TctC